MKHDVLEFSSVIVWRLTKKDIAEANVLFPGALRFAGTDAAFPASQRIIAVGGEPLPVMGAELLCPDEPTDLHHIDPSIHMVLAADDKERETLENGGLDVPCIVVGLGVTATQPELWPETRADLTFALVEENPVVARLLYRAFVKAFDSSDPVNLILSSVNISHRESLIQIVSEQPRRNAAVYNVDSLRKNDESGPLLFDLLLFDASNKRLSPFFVAAVEHNRAVPLRLDASGPIDDAATDLVAAHLRSVARSFLARGALQSLELAVSKEFEDRVDIASWKAKARVLSQIAVCQAPEHSQLTGVGWVTRWNVKCGISDHAAHQVAAAGGRNVILAPHESILLKPDQDNVLRCWRLDHRDDNGFSALLDAVYRYGLATVIFHFNWGFYEPVSMKRLVADLRAAGRVVVIDLHSTTSTDANVFRLRDFSDCLRLFHRVLVHQASDFERVRAVVPDAKIMIEPLAIASGPDRLSDRSQPPVIGCFGFCLPNKGIEQLVTAFWMLRQSNAHVRLVLLNAEYPVLQSAETIEVIRGLIKSLDLKDVVAFVTDYLEESECLERMSKMSLIVNPYQQTSESASAAARYALASGTPVLVTPLSIFDDLGDAVFRASGTRPQELCDSIRATLLDIERNSEKTVSVAAAAKRWRDIHDIKIQTHRLLKLTDVVGRNQRFQDWARFGAIG